MASKQLYQLLADNPLTPGLTDAVGFQPDNSGATEMGASTWQGVANLLVGKRYTAYLTQTSTSAPTAAIKSNTLGGVPVLTRFSAGEYTLTLTGAFTSGKTFIPNTLRLLPFLTTNFIQIFIQIVSEDEISISTSVGANGGGSPTDGVLSTTDIEIYVYN